MSLARQSSTNANPNRKLTPEEALKVLELLVARASLFTQEAQARAQEASRDPVHTALAGKVSAHATGQLAGLNRALLLIKGGWALDDDLVDAVHDIFGDSLPNR